MTALDEFMNSPRKFENDDGSTVVSSSLVKLGPGITATRPATPAGEPSFAVLDAPGVAELQTQITALTARVAALEAMLDESGSITVDSIEVRQIIAKGTGATPDLNVADLKIVVKTPAIGVYQEALRVVGRIEADMDPAPAISFFGASANKLQTLAGAYVAADVGNVLAQYNLAVEVP